MARHELIEHTAAYTLRRFIVYTCKQMIENFWMLATLSAQPFPLSLRSRLALFNVFADAIDLRPPLFAPCVPGNSCGAVVPTC